jgi:NAD(P)-dependent dehydrogenase (short-subunit alcohol dehydrogenase family)
MLSKFTRRIWRPETNQIHLGKSANLSQEPAPAQSGAGRPGPRAIGGEGLDPSREVVAVTGAGRGIGREIALTHARRGARVALLARSAQEIEAVAKAVVGEGGAAFAHAVDMVDLDSVTKAIAAVEGALGPISVLINNAASFQAIGPIWEVDADAWWRDVEVTLRGSFNGCRAVLPGMIARRGGRIINLAGGGSAGSFPQGSGYATGKAGVLRFTESVSDSLAGTCVRIFAMDPGLVKTSMTEYQLTSVAGRTYLPNIAGLFEKGIDVPPALAARLSVEIASGRFDRLAGRMLMAARGDLDLTPEAIEKIMESDLRSLRVNGMPEERRL